MGAPTYIVISQSKEEIPVYEVSRFVVKAQGSRKTRLLHFASSLHGPPQIEEEKENEEEQKEQLVSIELNEGDESGRPENQLSQFESLHLHLSVSTDSFSKIVKTT